MSKSLLRSALELKSPITRLPPSFLLPIRARWLSTEASSSSTTTTTTTTTPAAPTPTPQQLQQLQQSQPPLHSNTPRPRAPPSSPPPPQTKGPIPQSVRDLLPFLRAQPSHYITLHVHGRPYLVTPGDSVRLPFLMPGVQPGDVLRLNRASVLGSRDFTLLPTDAGRRDKEGGANEVAYIDERLYECRAVVVGVEAEPMRLKEKTKRRNRKVKTVRSKHKYTVLRISELKIKAPEEIEE
ncbi:hypothetical protein VPNG_07590 [Cytospora leucostoma]|uniref:Large ribosomal subunit protein bL21m n=1 Tax=Cytospora leucostoma TaxID=1230097 RepID=A0A423WDS0_9PEZI|nr:hypothetical protein VPNG_07590 [Cytospora leucostoma]